MTTVTAQPTRGQPGGLVTGGVETAQAIDPTLGGLQVDNQLTGTGFERVLTTSDLTANAPGGPINAVQFNNPLGSFDGDADFTYDGTTLDVTHAVAATPVVKLQMNSTGEKIGIELDGAGIIPPNNEYTALRMLGSAFGSQRMDLKYQYVDDSVRLEIETGAIIAQFGRDTIALGGSYNDPNNAPFTVGQSGYGLAGIGDVVIDTTLFMEGLPLSAGTIPATAGRFWVRSDTPPSPMFTTNAGGDNVLAFVADVVPNTRTLTAGAGLTGGGDLSADRTFDVVANADGSIVVNANDVQVGVLATDAQHGTRGGGTLHAEATTSVAGFLSAADKTKLDGLNGNFGAEFESDFEALEQSTTSPTYVTPYSYTTASLPAGDYKFEWFYDSGATQDKQVSHRVLIDGVEVSNSEWQIKRGVETDNVTWITDSGHRILTLTAGTHTIAFQYRAENTAYVRNKQVSIFRVA